MNKILYLTITAYILTVVITASSLLSPVRNWLMRKTPRLKIGDHPHFIVCRLCVGFWVSLALTLCFHSLTDMFIIYGLSYFMATQER